MKTQKPNSVSSTTTTSVESPESSGFLTPADSAMTLPPLGVPGSTGSSTTPQPCTDLETSSCYSLESPEETDITSEFGPNPIALNPNHNLNPIPPTRDDSGSPHSQSSTVSPNLPPPPSSRDSGFAGLSQPQRLQVIDWFDQHPIEKVRELVRSQFHTTVPLAELARIRNNYKSSVFAEESIYLETPVDRILDYNAENPSRRADKKSYEEASIEIMRKKVFELSLAGDKPRELKLWFGMLMQADAQNLRHQNFALRQRAIALQEQKQLRSAALKASNSAMLSTPNHSTAASERSEPPFTPAADLGLGNWSFFGHSCLDSDQPAPSDSTSQASASGPIPNNSLAPAPARSERSRSSRSVARFAFDTTVILVILSILSKLLMIDPAAPAKLTHNELIKAANPTLAGTIASTLAKPDVDRFAEDDTQFMKFHGIYQQDDRDKRKAGKEYIFMVRGRLPGGYVTPKQYLTFDDLATNYGNQTLRITTRQGFQFHGVVKSGLGKVIKGINDALATTLAACGDVTRNVMAPATPSTSPLVDRVLEDARRLSKALLPQTRAYHQIWVEGVELDLGNDDFVDPLYGKQYLPRKFKVAFAIPPSNDIDIYTNCLGFVAIAEEGKLLGYNMVAGGGMGMNHGNAETFPRLADLVGFFPPEHIETMAKAVLTVFRDYGDRTNRRHARLKYVLEERGVEWFRGEVEQRTGIKFEPPRPFEFTKQSDPYGWHKQFDGRNFFCLFVENGRIKDEPSRKAKTALRKVVQEFGPEVRLTASQNLIFSNVEDSQIDGINKILREHGVATDKQASAVRLASLACPALPTCGLALAESERIMPDIITRLEGLLAEFGLQDDEITVRMTGCPNGCARPYMAEIAFVGRAPNKYQVYLGGNENSTRLNKLFKENVKNEEIVPLFRPIFARFTQERVRGEHFGDWCNRVLLKEIAAPTPAPEAAVASI